MCLCVRERESYTYILLRICMHVYMSNIIAKNVLIVTGHATVAFYSLIYNFKNILRLRLNEERRSEPLFRRLCRKIFCKQSEILIAFIKCDMSRFAVPRVECEISLEEHLHVILFLFVCICVFKGVSGYWRIIAMSKVLVLIVAIKIFIDETSFL